MAGKDEIDDEPGILPVLNSAEELAEIGTPPAGGGSGETRAKIANAMVGLKKEHFGRGPTGAKAWMLDDYIFVVLEGGLTTNEERLLQAGRADVVRSYRLTFQEIVTHTAVNAIEEITGRTVAAYHSQIVFEPTRAFEIFVLEPEG